MLGLHKVNQIFKISTRYSSFFWTLETNVWWGASIFSYDCTHELGLRWKLHKTNRNNMLILKIYRKCTYLSHYLIIFPQLFIEYLKNALERKK